MRNVWIAASVAASTLLWPAVAEAQRGRGGHRDNLREWGGNIFVFGGQKQLDDDDWGELDTHLEAGLLLDVRPPNWPVNLVLDNRYSWDDDSEGSVDLEVSTWEVNLGVRKYFALGRDGAFQVFVGGGGTFGMASIEAAAGGQTESDDETGIGFWADAGAVYIFEGGFTLGVEIAYSTWDAEGEIEDESFEVDGGGLHFGVVIGFHW
jgi:opacity protein-like surface antigen